MASFSWGKKGKTKKGGKPIRNKLTKVVSHQPKTVARQSARGLKSPKVPGKPVKGLNAKSIKYSSKNLF